MAQRATRAGRPPARIAARASLCLLFASCAPSSTREVADTTQWPTGTVLVCAGDPILPSEVDSIAMTLKPLGPKFTLPHLRRLALTNLRLPLAAGRALAGEDRREEARKSAEHFAQSLNAPGTQALPKTDALDELTLIEGNQAALGLPLWVLVQGLEVGSWSPVSELPGEFTLVYLVDRDAEPQPQRASSTLRVASFPYVDDPALLAGAAIESTLLVVDPAWEPLVPGFWRYRMDWSPSTDS